MKTGLTILILFASFLGFSQSSSDTLFTFDLNKYNGLKERNLNHYFLEDSTKITFGETDGGSIYYIEISEFNSHFSSVFRYFKSTLTLEKSMEFFNRNKIGIEKEYDEQGNLLSAYNHDAVFIFSLQDLAKELHSNYNLDIMSFESAISVSIETSFKPLYNIAYPVIAEDSFGNWRFLQFDGITGEKLQDFEKAYECRSK